MRRLECQCGAQLQFNGMAADNAAMRYRCVGCGNVVPVQPDDVMDMENDGLERLAVDLEAMPDQPT